MSAEQLDGAPLPAPNGMPESTPADVDMTDGPETQPSVLPAPLPTSISQNEAPIHPTLAPSHIPTSHILATQAALPQTHDTQAQIQPQTAATAATSAPVSSHPQAPTPPARSSPAPAPAASSLAPPSQPIPNGSPARVYLNQAVTPHLLEGMKYLAVYEPDKPLKWLSEFLAGRSREVEGS